MVKTRFLHRHSLCNIRWIIQSFLIEYLSLDDIMDDNNAHTCHTPIDPNQLAILENLLQVQILDMEKAIQQQLTVQQ